MRFSQYLLAGAAAVSSVIAGLEDAKFSTKLTSSNFDSAISGKGSLVAFFAPWCGHCKSLEPTWTKVAKAFEDEDNVVVGHLDADNESNRPVASRYGVKGYPTIKWFSADGSAPQDYQGPRSEDAFIAFINEHAGTHRTATGVLNELAGRIPSLDTLVASFLSSSADARAAIVSQANQLSSQFTAKTGTKEATAASYYLKVMEKLSESSDWAQTELARLQKLASKRGTMAQKQVDDLQIRQNILAAFTAAKASASSIISDASASIDSATSKVAASASSASNAAFGAGNSAASSVSGQAASASANAQKVANDAYVAGAGAAAQASKSASSASANAGNYANSAYAAGASAASQASASAVSAGYQAGASVVSASNNAKGYANSAYAAGANAASQASASGVSAASQASASAASASANAAGYVNDAYASGASGASQVSKSAESAASQASASVDSAVSAASKSAASAYSKVAGEL